jgi:hypothetical protein
MSEQYEPFPICEAVVYMCRTCSSLVHNMAKHDEWHKKMSDAAYYAGMSRPIGLTQAQGYEGFSPS